MLSEERFVHEREERQRAFDFFTREWADFLAA
jgi:hypothetical protein